MNTSIGYLVVLAAGISASLTRAVAADPARIVRTSPGHTLVDAEGMTLYLFDTDISPGDTGGGSCLNGVWRAARP
ncbi:MAG: hypothetical protein P4M09_29060 [Devosia sp.]|nr:hypothetical protein [Devosia sp.]